MRITDVNIDSRPRNRNPVTDNEDKITLVVPNTIDETRRLESDGEKAKPSSVQQVTSDQYGEPLSQDDQTEPEDFTDSEEFTESEESDVIEDNDADNGDKDSESDEDRQIAPGEELPEEDEAPEPEPEPEPITATESVEQNGDEQESEPESEPEPITATEQDTEQESPNHRKYPTTPLDRIRDSISILPAMWRVTYQQASVITQDMRQERMEKRRQRREQARKRAEERRQQRMDGDKPETHRKGFGGFGALFGDGKGRRTAKGGQTVPNDTSKTDKPADGTATPKKRMTAQERSLERKRAKYPLILEGKLLNPDSYKYRSIWKNMVKDGYVEYRRMEYIIGIDRYRIDCSIVKHEDLPLGQHHVTGAQYTYAYDVNGVSFSSAKNNNFTAVSQYNYMHNRVFDDAMSYKWFNNRSGKKNNFLFYVIGVIVFSVGIGLYMVFMR